MVRASSKNMVNNVCCVVCVVVLVLVVVILVRQNQRCEGFYQVPHVHMDTPSDPDPGAVTPDNSTHMNASTNGTPVVQMAQRQAPNNRPVVPTNPDHQLISRLNQLAQQYRRHCENNNGMGPRCAPAKDMFLAHFMNSANRPIFVNNKEATCSAVAPLEDWLCVPPNQRDVASHIPHASSRNFFQKSVCSQYSGCQ